MKCIEFNGGIKISGVTDLDLGQTLDCGQCFRWSETENGHYAGTAYGKTAEVWLDGGDLYIKGATAEDFENIWRDYFDLAADYGKIRAELSALHPILNEAAKYAGGIRILRQEPFETLITFIISQNNNIKRIKGIVARLCENFGREISGGFAFPTAEALAKLSPDDLAPLRAGFRARYIIDAAQKVQRGDVNLEACRGMDYESAKAQLMKITGVGKKVADCTLLYGLHRPEAFPIDVWIKRAMAAFFPNMRPSDFGEYAGIAQQYIFHFIRTHPGSVPGNKPSPESGRDA